MLTRFVRTALVINLFVGASAHAIDFSPVFMRIQTAPSDSQLAPGRKVSDDPIVAGTKPPARAPISELNDKDASSSCHIYEAYYYGMIEATFLACKGRSATPEEVRDWSEKKRKAEGLDDPNFFKNGICDKK